MVETAISEVTISAGRLRARVSGPSASQVTARHRGRDLDGLSLSESEGGWVVEVPIPREVVSDGVEAITLCCGEQVLHAVTVSAGAVVAGDLTAEVALLRAELDLLKAAFRRHCAEHRD